MMWFVSTLQMRKLHPDWTWNLPKITLWGPFAAIPQIASPDLASWAGWHPVSPHPSQSVIPPTLRHIWVSQQIQLPKPRVGALATEDHSAPQGAAHVLHPAPPDPL